ncbi:hypothetical protein E1263_23315 [Kribbella antibiotica]|uniref:Prealbumin-like fold domain-containing protein n=1 Tax=Kribbella antibiotica TaxID=190195 RepID=A0A4R4ZG80_9ACTN|nr:hypothetical protein [Kribbella antibiotica]TDD57523.1 hypothetical protein E1263_23315 [Kribbella antibiotica]
MRILASVLAAPLLLGVLAPTAQAADPQLKIESIVLSRPSVAVSSLNTVPVTITMKATAKPSEYETYHVNFERVAGSGPKDDLYSMPLKLIAGSQTDGTWQGVVNVPSTVNGTIKATRVLAGGYFLGCSQCSDEYPVAVDGPPLVVNGVHVPKVTVTSTPKVVPFDSPFSLKWTITDSQTGKPYGTRLKVMLREDNQCVEGDFTTWTLTDTAGSITKKYPAGSYVICGMVPGEPAPILNVGVGPNRPGIVSATPTRTSAPVGTVVPVNGTVRSGYKCPVNLQRLYGATAWRTVGTATVRQSSRFTVNAQPAYKGKIPYRAQLPACYEIQAGVSKTFYITGT